MKKIIINNQYITLYARSTVEKIIVIVIPSRKVIKKYHDRSHFVNVIRMQESLSSADAGSRIQAKNKGNTLNIISILPLTG